jgi:putative PIN family toxin of toxin-antitoxin system
MNTTALKIVLDTNILLAIIGRRSPFRWIFDCLTDGKLILCVSNEILFEYQEVLARQLNAEIAENIINFIVINPFTEKVEIYFNFHLITEDPDDNKFVDCAIASDAICLVSNDTHFDVLKTIDFPRVTVLKLNEFEAQYKATLIQ